MTAPAGPIAKMMAGFAELIDATGIGVYRESGEYAWNEVGVTVVALPSTPDNVIVLSPYAVDMAAYESDATTGLQVRIRAGEDPRPLLDRADALTDLIHDLNGVDIGGIRVVTSTLQSATPMGQDGNLRHEHSLNFYIAYSRP